MIVVISLYSDEKNQLTSMRYCQFSMILGVAQIYVNQAKNI